MRGPDLLDLLNSAFSKKLPEPMAAFYFQQLLDAVIFMHNSGYCHRDLKAENCVIDRSSHTVKVWSNNVQQQEQLPTSTSCDCEC